MPVVVIVCLNLISQVKHSPALNALGHCLYFHKSNCIRYSVHLQLSIWSPAQSATIFAMTKENGDWDFENNNDFARFLERKNAESGLRDTAEMRKRISELEKRVASLEALVNKYVTIYQPNTTTNKSLGDIAGTIGAPPSA